MPPKKCPFNRFESCMEAECAIYLCDTEGKHIGCSLPIIGVKVASLAEAIGTAEKTRTGHVFHVVHDDMRP